MLAQPPAEVGADTGLGEGYNYMKNERHGSEDSGYFSRRGSKATTTAGDGKRDSVLTDAMEDIVEGAEEADDEAADLDEMEEGGDHARIKRVSPHQHSAFQTRPEEHLHPLQAHHEQSRVRIRSRFLLDPAAARKQAIPLLVGADEAVSSSRARDRKGASI